MQPHTIVLVMLATALLSGCAGNATPADAAPPGEPVAQGVPVQAAPTPNEWAVGKWWGYHAYFGLDDSVGQHFNAIVVEDQGDAWRLGSDDAYLSAIDAMFGIPILGTFTKDGLRSVDPQETPFTWYDFPLQEGKRWTFMDDPDMGELTAVATETVVQVNNLDRPGFLVNVTREDGSPYALYDHTETVGWFTNLTIFRPDGRVDVHAISMGFGDQWDGVVYATVADQAIDAAQVLVVPDALVEPAPYHEFEVDADATHVWAVLYAVAAVGGAYGTLVDPDGNRYDVVAAGEADVDVTLLELIPAIEGTWRVVLTGAGAAAITGIEAFTLEEESFAF